MIDDVRTRGARAGQRRRSPLERLWRGPDDRLPRAAVLAMAGALACDGRITQPAVEAVDFRALEPSLSLSDFTSAETCSACHPAQAAAWRRSSHAHAMTDPVFRALVARAQSESSDLGAYCHSCHSNVGSAVGRFLMDEDVDRFEPLVMEGVTCESCHRVSAIRRPSAAGHVLDPRSPMQGTGLAGDRSPFHVTERSEVLGTPELCATCHDVESPDGLVLEQPYTEWRGSPAADDGGTCKDCHMKPAYGPAAQGFSLPDRPLRDHTFLGPGAVAWSDDPSTWDSSQAPAELQAEVQAQLSGAVTIEVRAPAEAAQDSRIAASVTLESQIAGHRFPTGSSFFRQVWIRVRVLDADGRVVDLCDPLDPGESSCGADADPLYLSARLIDASEAPTFLPWRAVRLESNALAPLERRTVALTLRVPADALGPLSVDASVHFQTFPLDLLRDLELSPDHAVVFQLGAASASIRLLPRGER